MIDTSKFESLFLLLTHSRGIISAQTFSLNLKEVNLMKILCNCGQRLEQKIAFELSRAVIQLIDNQYRIKIPSQFLFTCVHNQVHFNKDNEEIFVNIKNGDSLEVGLWRFKVVYSKNLTTQLQILLNEYNEHLQKLNEPLYPLPKTLKNSISDIANLQEVIKNETFKVDANKLTDTALSVTHAETRDNNLQKNNGLWSENYSPKLANTPINQVEALGIPHADKLKQLNTNITKEKEIDVIETKINASKEDEIDNNSQILNILHSNFFQAIHNPNALFNDKYSSNKIEAKFDQFETIEDLVNTAPNLSIYEMLSGKITISHLLNSFDKGKLSISISPVKSENILHLFADDSSLMRTSKQKEFNDIPSLTVRDHQSSSLNSYWQVQKTSNRDKDN